MSLPRSTRHLRILSILLSALIACTDARSWDFAVAIGREVNFFARNRTLTGQTVIAEAVSLSAIAYDDTTHTMFLSDTRNNVSIFSYDLTERNVTSYPLLKRENGTQILGMAFDTVSRTLFWTDARKQVMMKMHVPTNGPPGDPVLLHDLVGQTPRGIALDVCNGYVYWTNGNVSDPSIERSKFDGSERKIVLKENLYEPVAVAIDQEEGKLYWTDDDEGIHFKIERSNLDGTDRDLLLQDKRQQPLYLTVDRDSVYWSDSIHSAIWAFNKTVKPGDYPVKVKSYFESHRNTVPTGIIARDNSGTAVDCSAPKPKKRLSDTPILRSYNNLTTSTEESDLTTVTSASYCLNDGRLNKADGGCVCKPGFSGSVCETSLCHNYCLRGECVVNTRGAPMCVCETGYTGTRCERNLCDGYCLRDGRCTFQNGEPSCECKEGSTGERCENSNDSYDVCSVFCASNRSNVPTIDTSHCRCETNHTAEKIVSLEESFASKAVLPAFGALVFVLILLIVVLSYYVNKLRRRPRIKKRFVVGKGVTPLTSRPEIPDNQCEITIENCCNMNICETPCFEPKLRTPIPRSNGAKKEEKNSLLDNMEGNMC